MAIPRPYPFPSHKKTNQVTCNPRNKRAFMTRSECARPDPVKRFLTITMARLLSMTELEKVLERRVSGRGLRKPRGCRCGGEMIDFRPTLRRRSLVVISERNRRHCRISSEPYSKRGGYYCTHVRLYRSPPPFSRPKRAAKRRQGSADNGSFFIYPPLPVTGP